MGYGNMMAGINMYKDFQLLFRKFEEYTTLILSFLISRIFYRKKNLISANIRRIVIIKLDHIGDVILSIPAIASLRAHFPWAYMLMVVNPAAKSLAELIPYIDEIRCYNARFFDRAGKGRRLDIARGLCFARDMRKRGFDLIVDLRGSFASLLYALIAKSSYRIDRGTYLILRKLGRLKSEHEAEVNLDMLIRAGLHTQQTFRARGLSLNLSQQDLDSADLLLRKRGEPGLKPYTVVIHPGGPTALKRWPVERYALLADQLFQEHDARIVLVGGGGEEQISQNIISAMAGRAIDLSGQTTLRQLAAVLRKADLFIGNDSGPMHLAAACGIKVIGLFGPTSPQRFSPYGDYCIALRMEKNCPPCMQDKCNRPGYRCIDQISVSDVMVAVRQMLSERGK